eukprot:CAMPEP_0116898376 /NCGR_PEP_ID=MMETSP0467-20121206/7101_1 /TAXON_ID=283647 /ORGANISM="Mesodinium pulex, Strain SPMC105" /LENGTH=51 /DNA_ID=CAMNT_0004570447 /DNA_START=793 /DNA_END=948 /DNA_ORIENTATION=-
MTTKTLSNDEMNTLSYKLQVLDESMAEATNQMPGLQFQFESLPNLNKKIDL